MKAVKQPLSNVQRELLKMYSTDITDSELGELKEKSIEYANKSWNERKLSNDIMNLWLDED